MIHNLYHVNERIFLFHIRSYFYIDIDIPENDPGTVNILTSFEISRKKTTTKKKNTKKCFLEVWFF